MLRKPPTMTDHALELVEALGVAVFPAKVSKDGQKMSHLSEKRSGTKWGQTKDAKRIREVFGTLGNSALIGIATGATTDRDGETYRLVVIDLDEKEGGESGVDTWDAFQADNFGEVVEAPIAKTTSGGGRHVYLLVPAEIEVRNSVGEFGPGIDVRGVGGMVLAPPSINPTNLKGYEWEVSPFDVPVPVAPEWVVAELRRIEAGRGIKKKPGRPKKVEAERRTHVQMLKDMGEKGKGHDGVLAFANSCAGKGWPKALVEIAVAANVHTFDDHARGLIEDAFSRYAPERVEPDLGGRFCILGEVDYFDREDWRTLNSTQMWRATFDWTMKNRKGDMIGPQQENRLGWLNDELPRYRGVVFDPKGGPLVTNPANRPPGEYLNSYAPLPDLPAGEMPEIWLEHLARIVPDEADREWVLEWLAFVVQRPGDKVNWSPVFIGPEGSGKDTLLAPVVRYLGHYANDGLTLETITGRFTSWLGNLLLGIVQERDGGAFFDKKHTKEALKKLIAAPPNTLRFEAKGKDEIKIENVLNLVFFVNEADALKIDRGSRRYFPVEGDEVPDQTYFARLWGYLDDGGAEEVAAYLLHYPIKHVRSRMHAPKSSALERIVAAGLGPVGQVLLDELEDRDWVTLAQAKWAADRVTENGNAVGKALEEIGFKRVNVPGGDRGRLRYRTGSGHRVVDTIYARGEIDLDQVVEELKQ